jgi:hypothetical protein
VLGDALFLDRIGRTRFGNGFGKHCVEGAVDRVGEFHAGQRVEFGVQIPHAVVINPRRQARSSPLPFQAFHAVIALDGFHLAGECCAELFDC